MGCIYCKALRKGVSSSDVEFGQSQSPSSWLKAADRMLAETRNALSSTSPPLQRVQKRHQIFELLLVEDDAEWWHVAAAGHDGLTDVLIGGWHPAGKSLLSEHAD